MNSLTVHRTHPDLPRTPCVQLRHATLCALLALLACGVFGCLDPFADSFTTRKVVTREVTGEYICSGFLGRVTRDTPGVLRSLTIRADGTWIASSFPDASGVQSRPSGSWQFVECQKGEPWTCLELSGNCSSFTLYVTGQQPPLGLLHQTWLEGSEGDGYTLIRAPI